MLSMRPAARSCGLTVALLLGQALAQQVPTNSQTTAQAIARVPWAIALTVDGYLLPDQDDYVNPTLSVDHGWLHLEGRYNYENLRTGSLWIGYNINVGKKLMFHLTPMIGGIFGRTTGIAPGFEASLEYKKVKASLSNEYVFDTTHKSGNFYYSWPELTYSPRDWFRVGLVAQRTKEFQTKLDTQRGFLVGFTHKNAEFTTYIFNVGWTEPSVVLEVGWSF
jgi:hypothetical protein